MPHTKKTLHSHISPPIVGGVRGGKHGFTLVELIVTITIIAILGAIAFTSFSGFQSGARDSSRATDLTNLSQALDTSYVKTGSYPNPDSSFTVTYSGGALWYQGTVGDTLINTLSSAGSKLSKKPTDPLFTTKEYTYSKSAYGNTYELKADWEGDRIAYTHLIPQTFAASGNPTIAYVKGNYNGMVAKTITGSTVYVIATPSLTTSTGTVGSNIDVTTLSGKLLYHGQTNSGGIAYTPKLIYSSGALPTNDDSGQITLFTTNLQSAYTGSVVSSNSNISNVLTTTGSTNIVSLGASIITNYLGGSASAPPPPSTTSYTLTNSLLFDSASSQYLSRTPTTAGNRQIFTFSYWVKRSKLSTSQYPFGGYISSNTYDFLSFESANDHLRFYSTNAGSVIYDIETTQVFRDSSSWYHIVVAYNSTQATASNRVKIYVNGSQVTALATASYPALDANTTVFNTINSQLIGQWGGSSGYFDGYLADVNFVDSGALDPTAFGYADPTTNQWLPKAYTGTYGTNGFHLDFSSGASLGVDSSGNNNTWTGVNMTTNNQTIDIPTNNFATLNPIDNLTTGATLQEGSLKATTIVTGDQTIRSTMAISSGKWYWETKINTVGAGGSSVGIVPINYSTGTQIGNTADSYSYRHLGYKRTNTTDSAYGDAFTNNDIIGVAYDADNGKIYFRKGATWQGSGDPVAGTNPAFSGITGTYFPAISDTSGATSCILTVNFGQRPFANPIPSGFKALSTANLPTPAIQNPKLYFDIITRNGSTNSTQTISGLSFTPDFVWIKPKNLGWNHNLFDTVRGAGKTLRSDGIVGDQTNDNNGYLSAFTSDGYILSDGTTTGSLVKGGSYTYVDWLWKKGSAITGPGFDIVSYTGNGGLNTIPHSLGKKPDFIAIKNRDNGTLNWGVYHSALGATKYMRLNTADPFGSDGTAWNNTEPTSTGFTVNTWTAINESTKKIIAYLWSEVPGFSKFGSYTGNGSSDGPFIYTGFRPRYVMIKGATATSNWTIWDTERDPFNTGANDNTLFPNMPSSEEIFSIYEAWDILSNGFKLRALGSRNNVSGSTYIYAAFAEAPFKYANAR